MSPSSFNSLGNWSLHLVSCLLNGHSGDFSPNFIRAIGRGVRGGKYHPLERQIAQWCDNNFNGSNGSHSVGHTSFEPFNLSSDGVRKALHGSQPTPCKQSAGERTASLSLKCLLQGISPTLFSHSNWRSLLREGGGSPFPWYMCLIQTPDGTGTLTPRMAPAVGPGSKVTTNHCCAGHCQGN